MSTTPHSDASFRSRTAADVLDEWRREHPRGRPLGTVPAARASGVTRTTPDGIRTDYGAPQYTHFDAGATSSLASSSLSQARYTQSAASSSQLRSVSSARVTHTTPRGTKPFLKTPSSSPAAPSHRHSGLSPLQTLGSPPAAAARFPVTTAGSEGLAHRAHLSSTLPLATFRPVSTTPTSDASRLATDRYAGPSAAPLEKTGGETSAGTHQNVQPSSSMTLARSGSPPVTPVKDVGETVGHEIDLRTCKERTLIILDWDDTLLPACASTAYSFDSPLPSSIRATLDTLSDDVLALLAVCRAHGQVMIITNAASGWVEDSGKHLLPAVLSYLQEHSIPIISAQHEWYQHRQLYHRQFYSLLHDPAQWKPASFATHVIAAGRALQDGDRSVGSWDGERKLNLISIGDSAFERMAAQALMQRPSSSRYVAFCKTVKFDDNPHFSRLRVQIQSIAAALPALATATTSMDLDMMTA